MTPLAWVFFVVATVGATIAMGARSDRTGVVAAVVGGAACGVLVVVVVVVS